MLFSPLLFLYFQYLLCMFCLYLLFYHLFSLDFCFLFSVTISTMNVGSILNNDSPEEQKDEETTHQRHSIVNILNEPQAQFAKPISPTAKKNSIVDITNDKDVDVNTGKETVNASRKSSISERGSDSVDALSPASDDVKRVAVPEVKPSQMHNTPSTELIDLPQTKQSEKVRETKAKETKETKQSTDLIELPKQSLAESKTKPDLIDETRKSKPAKKSNKQPGTPPSSTSVTLLQFNLPDDLAKIKQMKRKPRRYQTPPIWAQEYRPTGRRPVPITNADVVAEAPRQSVLTDKHALNFNSTPSVDLECSVTGIIPTSLITRTLSGWIFANFKNIPEENRKYVELELKFGRLIDKSFGKRLMLDITSECVYTNHSNVHFDMQIEEVAWADVHKLFQELENGYQNELKKSKNPKKPRRKFNTLELDTTDSFYQIGERGAMQKRVRVLKDNTLDPPRYSAINKQRIGDLYIYNPTCIYDLRFSLSLEMPVAEESIEALIARNQPVLVREKKRSLWVHAPTITRFDLTKVLVPLESKNKTGKTIVTYENKHEVELEVDTMELFSAIDKVDKGTDMFRFEELVEVFMNNARVLNNRVSSLAASEH